MVPKFMTMPYMDNVKGAITRNSANAVHFDIFLGSFVINKTYI